MVVSKNSNHDLTSTGKNDDRSQQKDGLDIIQNAVEAVDSAKSSEETKPKSSANERRMFPRRLSNCRVAVVPVKEQEFVRLDTEWQFHACDWTGEVADISATGIAFELEKPVELSSGQRIRVRIVNKRLDRSCIVEGEVIRAIIESDGQTRVMCQIKGRLSLDKLQEFSNSIGSNSLI